MYRQFTLAKKMEKLEKTISDFMKNQILTHILADVHQLRANADVRFDRVERSLTGLEEQLGSMKIGGGGMIRDAMKIAEATMEIETSSEDEKFGVGLEMGKRKVGLVEWVVSVRPLLLETLSVSVTMKSDVSIFSCPLPLVKSSDPHSRNR